MNVCVCVCASAKAVEIHENILPFQPNNWIVGAQYSLSGGGFFTSSSDINGKKKKYHIGTSIVPLHFIPTFYHEWLFR